MAKRIKKVKIDNFRAELEKALQEFADYVDSTVVKNATHKTAEETAEVIAKEAPKRTGQYSGTITSGYRQQKNHIYTETVYADAPGYRLTHLLEKGHASRSGGRVQAYPHWETGEKGIPERLITHIKEELE